MISIRKLIFVIASVTLIGTGCSSGGSSGESTGSLVADLSTLGNGISTTNPESTTTPGGNGPVTPPNEGAGELEKLLGTTIFGYAFNADPSIVFIAQSNLTPEGFSTADDGTRILAGTAIGAFRPVGEEDFVVGPSQTFACAQANTQILCVLFVPGGDLTAFLFNFLANDESEGAFEFCPVGTDLEACFVELASTPDGPLLVAKPDSLAVAEFRNANKVDDSAGDMKQFLRYAEQSSDSLSQLSSRSSNSSQNSAILEASDAIMNAIGN